MFAVIFTADIAELDDEYAVVVERLRCVAKDVYGCLDYVSVAEGSREMTVSYWKCMADIKKWRADKEHQQAQERGRRKWYANYKVDVVEVLRSYSMGDRLVRQADFDG